MKPKVMKLFSHFLLLFCLAAATVTAQTNSFSFNVRVKGTLITKKTYFKRTVEETNEPFLEFCFEDYDDDQNLIVKSYEKYTKLFSNTYNILLYTNKTEIQVKPIIYLGETCVNEDCYKKTVHFISTKTGDLKGSFVYKSKVFSFNINNNDDTAEVKPLLPSYEENNDILKPIVSYLNKSDDDLFPYFEYPEVYPIYVNTPVDLFVELLIVNDKQRLALFNGNIESLVEHSTLIAANTNLFYTSGAFAKANIQLVISGQVIFEGNALGIDESSSEQNPNEYIEKANSWRNDNLNILSSHDVLHVFSGLDFAGNVLGLAYLHSACDVEIACPYLSSGFCYYDSRTSDYTECCIRWAASVSMVRNDLNDARTIAHELGHQLGFSHDVYDSSKGCSSSGGIMAAITVQGQNWLDDEWSPCVLDRFDDVLTSRHDSFDIYNYHSYGCLLNQPLFYNESSTNFTNLIKDSSSANKVKFSVTLITFFVFLLSFVFVYILKLT